MVEKQIERRGVKNRRVLEAMRTVPRHLFIPEASRARAYEDRALPIGKGQTISQPYVVAVMTDALDPKPGDRVLEVGTGSGYGAAVTREVVGACGLVMSVELDPVTFEFAKRNLQSTGYDDVVLVNADGGPGYPKMSPYDRIAVTAACVEIPPPLVRQLAVGGKVISPIHRHHTQDLVLLERRSEGIQRHLICQVAYVALRGAY